VNLAPQGRNCGYVFQDYALFPHMTLRQNLEFAAERRPRLERHRRVNEMLERFRLGDAAGRRPHELSGGQRQRCSIARALIGAPKLLLLDEPAQGLDAPLRAEFYEVLRQVRADFKTPILLVTHNLDECFELGEEMLILREGRLVQSGAPSTILDQPANVDVALLSYFFGSKKGLFGAALALPANPPEVLRSALPGDPATLPERVLTALLRSWDDPAQGAPLRVMLTAAIRDLHRAFNGERDRLFRTIPAMLQLKQLAQALMQMPADGGLNAGPSFEYMPAVSQMRAGNATFSIKVLENGPYGVLSGGSGRPAAS